MAILLTTSYQLIGTAPLTYGEIRFYGRYYEQSVEGNYTNFQLKMTYYTWQNSLSFSSATAWLNGSRKDYGYTTFYKGETLIMEETRTAYHNQDGTAPVWNVGVAWNATFGGNGDVAVDVTFPKIDRYAMMTEATNFNDEDTPSFTYYNPRNLDMTAWLEINPPGDWLAIRNITNPGTSGTYYFTLTEAERNQLRSKTPNSNSATCRFGISSSISGVSQSSFKDRGFYIINANPTFTYTVEETNQKVIDLLGSSVTSVIKNASILEVSVSPTALKSSTISKVTITHDGKTYSKTTSPYTFEIPITANNFVITVIDSRGNTSAETVTKTLIDYLPLDILNLSFKRYNPTSSNVLLNLEATYYQQTFGSTTNTPVVKWKLDEGTETTIPSTEYSIDTTNHKLTITNYELTNILDYRQKGTFTIYLEDELSTDQDSKDVLKGIPTFDAGEHDLKVNGNLYIADTNGQNPVNVLENIVPKYIQAYLNTRYTAYITPWLYTFFQLSVAETNDSNMFIFDDANDRITIGPGVNKIEVSAVVSWWQSSGTGEFDVQITKNGQSLGNEFIVYGSTTTDINNRTITPIIINVQQGDYIQVCFSTGITSTEVLTNRIYIRKVS